MTPRQLAVLFVLGGVWGASFLFIKVLVDAGVTPIGVSAGRCALGTLTLVPLAYAVRRQAPSSRRPWALLALLGFVNFALPWTLFALAAQHAPSGASSIANSSQPLWAAILASFLLKADHLGRIRTAGLFLGFFGVLMLMGEDLLRADRGASLAILVLLFATFCYGFSAVIIRRFLPHVSSVFLASAQLGFASLYLVPLALVRGEFPGAGIGTNAMLSLILLGVTNSGVAVIGYMWLIREVGPVRAGVVTYLMPPIGVTLGWLVLGEPVGWNLLIGLTFVIAGVALVQQPPLRALARRLVFPQGAEQIPDVSGD